MTGELTHKRGRNVRRKKFKSRLLRMLWLGGVLS